MTGDAMDIRAKWNRRHAGSEGSGTVAAVLAENLFLLPQQGRALDLACGRGANALMMAKAGLTVEAWDISDVAIGLLRQDAQAQGLDIRAEVRDVVANPPATESYDVILVSHFLDRSLAVPLFQALRSGGLLFYQTFNLTRLTGEGPDNPDFRLASNELPTLFPDLRLVFYRENGEHGDTTAGLRDISQYIGEKISG